MTTPQAADIERVPTRASGASKGSLEKPHAIEEELSALPTAQAKIAQQNAALYQEALERYGADGSGLDPVAEKKLRRKLDWHIIPALAVCYFFYVR